MLGLQWRLESKLLDQYTEAMVAEEKRNHRVDNSQFQIGLYLSHVSRFAQLTLLCYSVD
jgi:hypothetical protein